MRLAVSSVSWFRAGALCVGLLGGSLLFQSVSVLADEVVEVGQSGSHLEKAKALYEQAIGLMVDDNNSRAVQQRIIDLFSESAGLGYAPAQVDLGKVYYFGFSGKRDDVLALEWFRRAAEQGDARGQYHLGQMYTEGKGGLKESEQLAAVWYEKSAKQGYAPAQYYLAILYLAGVDGIEKDYDRAIVLLRKSAAQGDRAAIELMGKLQAAEAATVPAVEP